MDDNGHMPEGARVPTTAELRAWNRRWVKLPDASEKAGQEVGFWVRAIRRQLYYLMLPPPVPGSEAWPEKDEVRQKLYDDWVAVQPCGTREQRQFQVDEAVIKVVVLGVIEPKQTEEDARDLGSDAEVLYAEILRLSGVIKAKPAPKEAEAPTVGP